MSEYFARQLTGSKCGPKNCAAASGAMAVMFALGRGGTSADEFRERSGVSCVPGEHSKSGGLFISDVERAAATYGVAIDYGRDKPGDPPKRWSEPEAHEYLSARFVGIFLGDYDQMGSDSAQPSFKGDHSSLAHDYSDETDTVCFHDPLRTKPIRVTWARLMKYWRKPGSPVLGLAGFVAIKEETMLKVTMTGKPGSIVIIPNPANRYYDLATRTFLPKDKTYGFTSKDPAIRVTTPPVNGITDWYLVGGDLALIPVHNATFSPYPAPVDCSATVEEAVKLAVTRTRAGAHIADPTIKFDS